MTGLSDRLAEPRACCGHLDSDPPYVGGDDDEIERWRATCCCGWKAERWWDQPVSAHMDLAAHMKERSTALAAELQAARTALAELLRIAQAAVDNDNPFLGEQLIDLAAAVSDARAVLGGGDDAS